MGFFFDWGKHPITILVKFAWTPNLLDEVFEQDYDGLGFADLKQLFIDAQISVAELAALAL